jgi:hypothetical protein
MSLCSILTLYSPLPVAQGNTIAAADNLDPTTTFRSSTTPSLRDVHRSSRNMRTYILSTSPHSRRRRPSPFHHLSPLAASGDRRWSRTTSLYSPPCPLSFALHLVECGDWESHPCEHSAGRAATLCFHLHALTHSADGPRRPDGPIRPLRRQAAELGHSPDHLQHAPDPVR